MSANAVMSREHVHRLSEECAAMGMSFQPVARRLLEDQSRLLRFFKANLPAMENQAGEVSLYLLAVVVRVFDQSGGRLRRVGPAEIEAATKVIAAAGKLLPADPEFPGRVRAMAGRSQPHLLDEALHALFEREEIKEQEVALDPDQSALVFLMLWAATEALDRAWSAPPAPDWAVAAEPG